MKVLIRKFGLLVCFLSVTTGFSITSNNKPLQESGLMTEDKYDCLVKLFLGEHTARLELRQQVNQKQLQQHQQLTQRSPEETVGANEDIDTRFTKLEEKYNSLLQKQESFYYDLLTNQSKKHEDEHARLEEKITLLEKKNEKLEATVFESENVHSYFALNTSQELKLIMDKQQELETELNNTSAEAISNNVVMKVSTNQELTRQKTEKRLSQLNSRIDQVYQDLNGTKKVTQSSTKKVAVTACMDSTRTLNVGEILRFPSVRSIVGINNTTQFASTGIFVCEDAGLYLITVTSATHSGYTNKIRILKNNLKVLDVYDETSKGLHTSTGVATVEVKESDTISVESLDGGRLYSDWSCLTIIKVV